MIGIVQPNETFAATRLTQQELAARWRVSVRTLERWNHAGTGPVLMKLNGRILYRLEDVLAFERVHLDASGR